MLEQLTRLLEQEDRRVVTMDLQKDDGSASFGTYVEVVCAAHLPSDDADLPPWPILRRRRCPVKPELRCRAIARSGRHR
jgi:hypothetical protein